MDLYFLSTSLHCYFLPCAFVSLLPTFSHISKSMFLFPLFSNSESGREIRAEIRATVGKSCPDCHWCLLFFCSFSLPRKKKQHCGTRSMGCLPQVLWELGLFFTVWGTWHLSRSQKRARADCQHLSPSGATRSYLSANPSLRSKAVTSSALSKTNTQLFDESLVP